MTEGERPTRRRPSLRIVVMLLCLVAAWQLLPCANTLNQPWQLRQAGAAEQGTRKPGQIILPGKGSRPSGQTVEGSGARTDSKAVPRATGAAPGGQAKKAGAPPPAPKPTVPGAVLPKGSAVAPAPEATDKAKGAAPVEAPAELPGKAGKGVAPVEAPAGLPGKAGKVAPAEAQDDAVNSVSSMTDEPPAALPPSARDGAGEPVMPSGTAAEEKTDWTPPEKDARAKVRLFGTIEFRSKLKDMPKWERVLKVERVKAGLDMPAGLAASWHKVREKIASLPPDKQVIEVNKFFNRFPYRLDSEAYGIMDYWATPAEFMAKSGDCEDYAIIKYFALRQLGFDTDALRIVVLTDTIRNLAHGVLAVYIASEVYILDNLSNLAMSHNRLKHYKPQFSVNEKYRWVHMVPKK